MSDIDERDLERAFESGRDAGAREMRDQMIEDQQNALERWDNPVTEPEGPFVAMNTDKPSDPIEVLRDLHDPECVTRQFISGRLSDAGFYEVQYRLLDGPHWFPVHKTPRCDCGANAAIAALEAERASNSDARKALWIDHGHSGIYGDDGEMQCGQCGAGAWDYKRDPIDKLVLAALTSLHSKLEVERATRKRVAEEMRTSEVVASDPYSGADIESEDGQLRSLEQWADELWPEGA